MSLQRSVSCFLHSDLLVAKTQPKLCKWAVSVGQPSIIQTPISRSTRICSCISASYGFVEKPRQAKVVHGVSFRVTCVELPYLLVPLYLCSLLRRRQLANTAWGLAIPQQNDEMFFICSDILFLRCQSKHLRRVEWDRHGQSKACDSLAISLCWRNELLMNRSIFFPREHTTVRFISSCIVQWADSWWHFLYPGSQSEFDSQHLAMLCKIFFVTAVLNRTLGTYAMSYSPNVVVHNAWISQRGIVRMLACTIKEPDCSKSDVRVYSVR